MGGSSAEQWWGITGAVGVLYGAVGAWHEYQQIQNTIADAEDVANQLFAILDDRNQHWRDNQLDYLLWLREDAKNLAPWELDCSLARDCAQQASQQIATSLPAAGFRLLDRYHARGVAPAWGNPLAGAGGRVAASLYPRIAAALRYRARAEKGIKDGYMAHAYGAGLSAEIGEAAQYMANAQAGHASILGIHINALNSSLQTMGNGVAAIQQGFGGGW